MNYQSLDKRIKLSWRISRGIRLFIFSVVLGIITLLLSLVPDFSSFSVIVFGIDFLLLSYMVLSLILYPIIEYRQWGYAITEDKAEIRHGLFFVTTSVIPMIRIQHITATQGPINRALGLSHVTIHTASGSFDIVGLSEETAKSISETLKQRLTERLEEEKAGI